jgi:hypothetical protein
MARRPERKLEVRRVRAIRVSLLLTILSMGIVPVPGLGAGDVEAIHWAFAAYFGMGRYEVDAGESVYQLSVSPGKRLDRAFPMAREGRSLNLRLRVPVALGVHKFGIDDIGSTFDLDNASTFSVVPGVEFEMRMSDKWSLKPLIYAGWGAELDGDSTAWIYWTGIKSQLKLGGHASGWALVNGLTYMGYSSNSGSRGDVVPLLTGVEYGRRLGNRMIAGSQVRLHGTLAFTKYLNKVDALPKAFALDAPTIDDEWEIGAAFSTDGQPLSWWRISLNRIGIAYRLSSDGDFEAFSIVFQSLFDR